MDQAELWATWKRLVRLLPVWRMPYEWLTSPSMYSLFGVDFLSGLRRNRSTRLIFEELTRLTDVDLRRMRAVAELNHRRQEVVSRWFAIGFVTVPASAALTLSELSPQTLRTIAGWEGAGRWYLMLAYTACVVCYYQMCAWRARQLLTLVDMHCIDRGVLSLDDGSSGEGFEQPLNG